jgi:hypothetical protein
MNQDWLFTDTLRIALFITALVVIWCVSGKLRLANVLRAGDARKINHIAAFVGGGVCFGWLSLEKARLSGFVAGVILILLVLVVCRFCQTRAIFLGVRR